MPNILAASAVCTSLFIDLEEMWHNSANKFFDALAAGKPVAVNYGGWQSAILAETGAGITLDPNDLDASARKLAGFLNSRDELERAGAAALELARRRFDRDTLAAELLGVLDDAIQDAGPNAAPRRTAGSPLGDPMA